MRILKNNLFLFFFLSSIFVFAQDKYAFNENFDNSSTWPKGNNEKRELKIYNGRYYFEYKKDSGSWNVYSSKFDFDDSRDFEISTSIQKISGVQDYAFGLLFNKVDDDNFSQFTISANGYFRVAITKNSDYTAQKNWSKSSAIKTGNYAVNTLKIKKIGNNITFYINGTNVYNTTYTSFIGTKVGVIIYKNQKISVDYLRVKYLNNSSNIIKVTSTNFLDDNFNNNKNNWAIGNTSEYKLEIKNNKYYFEHKRTNKGWSSTLKNVIDINKDFIIEAKFLKISGIDNNGYGIIWGRKDGKNQNQFLINAIGSYSIDKYKKGKFIAIKDWTKESSLKKGNYATNTLTIKKIGNQLKFFINNNYIYTKDFEPFYGDRVGFVIFQNQKIAIDYIKIKSLSNNTNVTNTSSKGKTLMYDSFFSNRNSWAVGSASEYNIEIKNSKYYFEHKRTDKGWSTTIRKPINTNRDFIIKAKFLKISGIDNNGYGIIWGRKDGKNQNQFLINAIGSYSIDKYKKGKYFAIKDWTKESSLKKGNYATNTLSIEKKGKQLKFFINDNYVYSKNFESFYGNRIGFIIFQNQKIAIDYISIKYLDNEEPITYNNSSYVFNEQFNNNNNQWLESDTEDTRYVVKNGKYYFKHKKDKRGYSSYISKYFDDTKDFEIKTKINKISGVTNYSYGVLWGKRDKNSFRFYLTGNGYYKIVRNKEGKEEKIINWTKTDLINTGNGSSNIIKIKKVGNSYKFYINNSYVNETDYEPFYGNKIGYVVFNNQEVAVDYLTVKYLKKDNNTITTKSLTLPLSDNFSSNNKGWILENTDNYYAKMVNGKLNIKRKKKGGIFISKDVNIDTSKDFVIETDIAIQNKEDSGLYGVTFGRKNSSNEYSFFLSNGDYMLRKFDNNKYTKIIPFTSSSAIKTTSGAYNTIKIIKAGNLLRFYINNQYVNETPFTGFFGNKFGYSVFYPQTISVNNLSIKYQSDDFNTPPTVVITSPNVKAKRGFKIVKSKKILVKGKATDKDGIYEVTINGVDATVYEDGSFMANVPLKIGTNNLVVKATDIKQASSTKTFIIKRKSPDIVNNDNVVIVDPNNNNNNLDVGFGKYYALLIGISDYGDSAIPDLEGIPKKDAQDLANVLINKYNFKRENVIILNNSPRANDIIKEFIKLKKKVTNKDNLLVFYAGHGIYDKKNEIGHWLPADADMEYELNLISNTQVVDYLKSIKSKHTLLISDACFSGSIFKHRSFSKSPKSIQKKHELTSRKAITSGTLKTVPNKSVFLKYLLKRLNNNNNKYFPARKLFDQIEEPVMNNSPNTPQYGTIYGIGDEGGDFIFIKKK